MSKVQLFISPEQKTAQKAIKFKIIVINVYLKEHKHYFKVGVSSQNDTPFWCTRLAISSRHDHREFAGWRTQCHISSAIADNRRPSTSVSLSVQLERPQQTTRSRSCGLPTMKTCAMVLPQQATNPREPLFWGSVLDVVQCTLVLKRIFFYCFV